MAKLVTELAAELPAEVAAELTAELTADLAVELLTKLTVDRSGEYARKLGPRFDRRYHSPIAGCT